MEGELKEEVVWDGPEKATMTVTKKKLVVVEGKEVGLDESTYTLQCTGEDVLKGKELLEFTRDKTQGKIDECQNKIAALGGIPKKTTEIKRLISLMQQIGVIETHAKLKVELGPLEVQLLRTQHNIKERDKVIESRPGPAGG